MPNYCPCDECTVNRARAEEQRVRTRIQMTNSSFDNESWWYDEPPRYTEEELEAMREAQRRYDEENRIRREQQRIRRERAERLEREREQNLRILSGREELEYNESLRRILSNRGLVMPPSEPDVPDEDDDFVPRNTDNGHNEHRDHDTDNDGYCALCDAIDNDHAYDADVSSDGVMYYSYKPTPMFHGNGPLFLGPELEIVTPTPRREASQIAHDYLGNLGYLKEDGSIHPNGFEIVTHPMTYEWAMNNYPFDMLKALRKAGCGVNDSTGLHVHVSKRGFAGPAHVYRWMKFFYRNERFIKAVARRGNNSYASFTDYDRRDHDKVAKGTADRYNMNRYAAINATNLDTFELRIFASTLNPIKLQAAFGLADATVKYTKDLNADKVLHSDGWKFGTFAKWADENGYEPLVKEMTRVCAY